LKYYNCQIYYFDIIVIIILNNFLYFDFWYKYKPLIEYCFYGINKSKIYVNVTTEKYPHGEIRGQLHWIYHLDFIELII